MRNFTFRVFLFLFISILLFNNELSNINAADMNLIPNPSVESVSSNTALPQSWTKKKSGVQTSTLSYLTTGYTGYRSLKVLMKKYTSGDSHFQFNSINISPSKTYTYSNYYKADVYTEVDAEITMADGSIEYLYLGSPVPSTTWNKYSIEFKTPANAKKITIYHAIATIGYLITDEYSLVSTPEPIPLDRPLITLTFDDMYNSFYQYAFPLFKKYNSVGTLYITSQDFDQPNMMNKDKLLDLYNNGIEMGSHTVTHPHLTSLTPTELDYELKNSRDSISQYLSIPIKTFASPYGEYNSDVLAAIEKYYQSHRSTDVGTNSKSNTNRMNIRAESVTSETPISTVLGWVEQAAIDKSWLVIVYHDVRPDDGSGFLWTTTPQDLEAVLKKASDRGVTTVTVEQALNEINNVIPNPLSIDITSPNNGETVSNSITLNSNISGDNILNVQYKVDGLNVGLPISSFPYSLIWDTHNVQDGTHVISAYLTDNSNNIVSDSITVNVKNAITPITSNLIQNPSFEDSANSIFPDGWINEKSGSNNSTFEYLNTGHTGNRSMKVTSTSFNSGMADLQFNPVTITAGKDYEFKLYYKSSDYTELDAVITNNDDTISYMYLGTLPSSSNWTEYKQQLTMPINSKKISIYLGLTTVGYLITDDYSLVELPTKLPLQNAIVSLTFDDGFLTHYNQARTILGNQGYFGTFFIDTAATGKTGRMTVAQYKSLSTLGHEIGSHTVSHLHLTTLTSQMLDDELRLSKQTLENNIGKSVTNLASPFGEYNDDVLSNIKTYYSSHRSTDVGFNYLNRYDLYNIKVQNVNKNTSLTTVKSWIDQAIHEKSWLVLVYHDIKATGDAFSTSPANLTSEVAYLKQKAVSVKTIEQAIIDIKSQL